MTSRRRYWQRYWDLAQGLDQRQPVEEPALELRPSPIAARPNRGALAAGLLDGRGLAGTGQPLSPALRKRLEAGFGADLAAVQVVRDEAVADALDAEAVTLGDRIVLGPAVAADDELLGHETAHVVQSGRLRVVERVGDPEGQHEREARVAAHTARGGLDAPWSAGPAGSPAPALQRQERKSPAPGPTSPAVRREAVRLMLLVQYQQQGGKGMFALTPAVRRELRRLLPLTAGADLVRLWTPPPAGPMEAFARLEAAGLLPTIAPIPEQEPEQEPEIVPPKPVKPPKPAKPPVPAKAAEPVKLVKLPEPVKKKEDLKPKPAMPPKTDRRKQGGHARLVALVPPPLAMEIRRRLGGAIALGQRQIATLLADRAGGVGGVDRIIRRLAPALTPNQRIDLAETIVDALRDAGMQGELERGAAAGMPATTHGSLPSLLADLPPGSSVTISFV